MVQNLFECVCNLLTRANDFADLFEAIMSPILRVNRPLHLSRYLRWFSVWVTKKKKKAILLVYDQNIHFKNACIAIFI